MRVEGGTASVTVEADYLPHSYKPGAAMLAEPVSFPFLDAAAIVVTHVAAATAVRTVLASGLYELNGDGPAGTGTIRALGVWPAQDDWIVERSTPLVQPAEIKPGEPLPAKDIERVLDRAVMSGQETSRAVDDLGVRALTVAEGAVAPDLADLAGSSGALLRVRDNRVEALPSAAFAGKFYGGDAQGRPVPLSGTGVDVALRGDLASPAAGAGLIAFGTYLTLLSKVRSLHVNPEDFGAFGNGMNDDSVAWASMLAALRDVGGGVVLGRAGAVYRCAAPPLIWDNIDVDLNAATLWAKFPAGADIVGVQLRNNAQLRNGVLRAWGDGGPTGLNPVHHCAIVIGETGSGGPAAPAGYSGWYVGQLTIQSNRDDNVGGSGIIAYASSHNGTIEDIVFPDSATLSCGVRVHWASYTPPGDGNPSVSAHPHDIAIRNIQAGVMTKPAQSTGVTADAALIDIVSGYNIAVERVTARRWSGDALAQVRCGAFGSAVADPLTKALFMTGITFDKLGCGRCDNDGFLANGRAHGGGAIGPTQYAMPVEVTNCTLVGAGVDAPAGKAAFKTAFTSGLTFDNCEGAENYYGFFADQACANIRESNGRWHHNRSHGVLAVNSNDPPDDIAHRNTRSWANGQAVAGSAGFYAEKCSNVSYEDCVAGDSAGETIQTRGFRVEATADGTRFRGVQRVFVPVGGQRYQFSAPVIGDRSWHGGSSAVLSSVDATVEYLPIEGVGAPSASPDAATIGVGPQMVVTNFHVAVTATPGGAGRSRDFKLVTVAGGSPGGTGLDITLLDNEAEKSSFVAAILPANSAVAVQAKANSTPNAARATYSATGFLG